MTTRAAAVGAGPSESLCSPFADASEDALQDDLASAPRKKGRGGERVPWAVSTERRRNWSAIGVVADDRLSWVSSSLESFWFGVGEGACRPRYASAEE